MSSDSVSFWSRFFLAFACFFRVLGDGRYAFAVRALDSAPTSEPPPSLPAREEPVEASPEPPPARESEPPQSGKQRKADAEDGALSLLSLLQREGRLVDFLKQDVADFADDEVGAAARVVHSGCRRALFEHVTVEAVRDEEEGAPVTIAEGYATSEIKLTGNVRGSAPFRGTLRHRGWRATQVQLPRAMAGHDASIVAPAEVEL